jgi:hypothetical protein
MSPLLFLAIAIVVPLLGMIVLGVGARIKHQKVTDDETGSFRRRLESIAPPSPDDTPSGTPGLVRAMRRRKGGNFRRQAPGAVAAASAHQEPAAQSAPLIPGQSPPTPASIRLVERDYTVPLLPPLSADLEELPLPPRSGDLEESSPPPSERRSRRAMPRPPVTARGRDRVPPRRPVTARGRDRVPPRPPEAARGLDRVPPRPPEAARGLDRVMPRPPEAARGLDRVPPRPPEAARGLDRVMPRPPEAARGLDRVPPRRPVTARGRDRVISADQRRRPGS